MNNSVNLVLVKEKFNKLSIEERIKILKTIFFPEVWDNECSYESIKKINYMVSRDLRDAIWKRWNSFVAAYMDMFADNFDNAFESDRGQCAEFLHCIEVANVNILFQ